MIKKNVTEAKAELSKLLVLAEQGEEIIITRAGKPIVRLTLIENQRPKRVIGMMKGQFGEMEEFDRLFIDADKVIEAEVYANGIEPL